MEEKKNIMENRALKALLIASGTISLALGIIGIVVPVLPTTPFLLLAAACYARSSGKFYNWFIGNRVFGKYILNYREGRGIPAMIKVLSITFLWAAIITSICMVDNLPLRIILTVIASIVTLHIVMIKTYNQK